MEEDRAAESGEKGDVIRSMRESDLPEVLAIEGASFTVPWSEATFRDLLANEEARALVVEREGSVGGYAVFWRVGGEAELGDLAVDVSCRRRGIGGRLLEHAEAAAREAGAGSLFLEVRESNEAARALYRAAGYQLVGRRRGYYRYPVEDALILRKSLGNQREAG